MTCPNCERYRATLAEVRECLPNSPQTTALIDAALAPRPEDRGETPLFTEAHHV